MPRLAPAWLAAALLLASPAGADREAERLRALDLRLATVAWRLVTGNAALCRAQAPATGLLLHALDQYPAARRARVRAAFGFEAAVGVEAVVAASPAATAGVRAGDSLVAVDGVRLAEAPDAAAPTTAGRDAALATIAARRTAPLTLTLRREGVERRVTLAPLAGCAVTVEGTADGLTARAGTQAIQVGLAIVARYDDDALAAVVAHELAFVVLRHHDRLAALGYPPAQVRLAEDQADALSPALLYNAGFDPGAATRLWHRWGDAFEGRRQGRVHGSAAERAAATAAAAAIPAGAPRPWRPPEP